MHNSVIARNLALVAASAWFAAPALADTYQWSAGEYVDADVYDATTLSYSAPSTLAAGSLLNVSATDPSNSPGGNSKLFYEVGFTNDGVVNWNTLDPIEFWSSTITNNGQFITTAATSLLDYAGTSAFVNNGTFQDTGGGTVTVPASSAFTFTSSSGATITASNAGDTILFTDGGGGGDINFANNTTFSGAGTITIGAGGATFTGAQNFTGSNLLFTGSSPFFGFTGAGTSGATLNGNATWNGGAFIGTWTLPTSHTLTVNTSPGGSNTKQLLQSTFTNNGTIAWNTADPLQFYSSTLTNNGKFVTTAATSVVNYAGTSGFVNNGTFQDNGGGTVTVSTGSAFAFTNNSGGTITASNAGDNIVFSDGNGGAGLSFANNTIFSGAGTITIGGGGATFTGAQNFAGINLVLTGGSPFFGFTGAGTNGATLNGNATWNGGAFIGTWTLPTSYTLTVNTSPGGSNTKQLLQTNFTNNGTVNWGTADTAVFYSSTLTNNGTFNVSNDASLSSYAGTTAVVNNGLFEKTGGTGTTTIAGGSAPAYTNNGVTQVLSGTIALGRAFVNPGTLAGTATFSAGTLTNNGHVAPGAYGGAPGALALSGNYVQSSTGFLDIGLTGTSNSIFNVSGTAQLAGTVNVDCVGACSYAAGTELEILTTGSSTSLTGDFANIAEYGFSPATTFTTLQQNGDEFLVIGAAGAAPAPVPVPPAVWMLLSGLGGLGLATRRRNHPGTSQVQG